MNDAGRRCVGDRWHYSSSSRMTTSCCKESWLNESLCDISSNQQEDRAPHRGEKLLPHNKLSLYVAFCTSLQQGRRSKETQSITSTNACCLCVW
mmetsp:Transcript_42961/g.63753  ORF Transcript_42961/g.63753 Transcript_42961/m.63753 type:complete len:94 (+) Transcript_42961:96-377(+)